MTSNMKETVIKVIAIAVAFGLISSKAGCDAADNPTGVCTTPGCIRASSKILEKIDLEMDPCDNFYKFACGKFLKSKIDFGAKTRIISFTIVADKVQEQLKITLEGKSQPNEPKAFEQTRNFYRACINTALIEQKGRKPLLDRLELLGGWPVLAGDKWQEKDFDWKQAIYKARNLGYLVKYFFELSVQEDPKDNRKHVLFISQAQLLLDRDDLLKGFGNKVVDAYYRYMVNTAVLLGADKVRAEKELKESLEFEMKLAEISIPKEQQSDPAKLYNPITIKQLSQNYKSIPWREYVNNVVKPSIKIVDEEIVNLDTPSYIKEFEKIMSETPKRTQANYAVWRTIDDSIDILPDSIRKEELKYLTVRTGQTERNTRWKECIVFTSQNFDLSVGALYVRKYFSKEAKKNALEMVVSIHQEFEKILKTVDWMDEQTRMRALDKAKSMINHVGYPDELLDNKKLDEFYGKLVIKDDDYFQSYLNINTLRLDEGFGRLRKPVDKSTWIDHGYSAVVNAFYSLNENSIMLPAGILQDDFFDKDYPKYMNYGAIGQVIGHETTHGFDSKGRQFDKDGNLIDWWQRKTEAAYLERAQCIIEQYNNYVVTEVGSKLNGGNTQGENIADNGGVKTSYLAYQEWVKQHGTELKLPNLNYSPSQLFWISAGNLWCSKVRLETLASDVRSNTHSPSEFRVVGPFSNRLEFAADFGCVVGSKMNPEKKCSVW